MLEAVKLAMALTSDAYDSELESLITAGCEDLSAGGVIADTSRELVRRAVITYCRMHFGSPADYDRLAASYELQKAQLMHATGYTDWGSDA